MKTDEPTSTTDALKGKMLGTTVLVVFGCMASIGLTVLLPALFLLPVRQVTTPGTAAAGPQAFPFAALIPLGGMALAFALVIFGIYRVIRLYMQYRKSKAMDEVLFQ